MSIQTFYKLVLSRHSIGPKHQTIPAPDVGSLRLAVSLACHVPNHEEKLPFRFVEITSREKLADLFESNLEENCTDEQRERARSKALKGPMCIALIETNRGESDLENIGVERLMSAGAGLMNFLTALHALGFAAKTVSGRNFVAPDNLYDPSHERLLAFVLVGTPDAPINYNNIGQGNDEHLPLTRW